MKKVTAVEATRIIGGTCKTCESTYQLITTGSVKSCKLVTTCTDKHGTVISSTSKDAASSNCGVLN